MTEVHGPRRRAPRIDAHDTREAVRLLGPIHRRIGDWQMQAARIAAASARLGRRGSPEPALSAEAEALAQAIEVERRQLAAQAENLPPSIARNGRFADTLRALDTLASGVSRALTALRSGPSGGHGAHGL